VKQFSVIYFILFFLLISLPISAHTPQEQELAREEEEMIDLFYEMSSLPTRTPQMVTEVPAIMTVITAEEIKQMGARDMRDVLANVPGMQIGISAVGYSQIIFRGMASHGSEKIKYMIDGHDVDISVTGGATLFFSDLAVDYIEKVEVLHGPGSALYGSDALLGVINIVTRKERNQDTASVTTRFGSYDSQRYNMELGRSYGTVHFWSNLNYYNTNGADVSIDEDGLSGNSLNADISSAPSNTNEWVERTDLSFGAGLGNWHFQAQYLNHNDGGFYNPGFSLTDETVIGRNYFWSDLRWKDDFFDDQLTLQTKLIYNRYSHDYDILLQPPGFLKQFPPPTGLTSLSSGMRSITKAELEDLGAEAQADFYFTEDHIVTLGGEAKKTRLFDVTHDANYNSTGPLPDIQDVSDTFNWMNQADRTFYSFYGQDQWHIRNNLLATFGGRYDHYDDFGSSFSPSLGLNWQFHQEWYLKLMYGEAFRAPSFRELYKQSVGTPLLGDPNLNAEDVQTWQAALEWHHDPDLSLSASVYWNEYENIIFTEEGTSLKTFVNGDDSRSRGINLVGKFRLPPELPDITLIGSLSYIDAEQDNRDESPGIASWLATAGFNLRFAQFCTLNMNCQYVGEAPLEKDDARDDIDDYLLTSAALTIEDGLGKFLGLDAGISIYNLFDVHYAYPEFTEKLPDNFERPGITAEVWLKYSF
jgi:outer membrane receptor for ferrienterochelin and colicins